MKPEPLALNDIPALCTAKHVMRLFQISSSRYYDMRSKPGTFRRLLDSWTVTPAVGPARYSGVLIRAYIERKAPLEHRTFGKKSA